MIKKGDICIYGYKEEGNKSVCVVEVLDVISDEIAEIGFLQVFFDDSGNNFFNYMLETDGTMKASICYLKKIDVVDTLKSRIEELEQFIPETYTDIKVIRQGKGWYFVSKGDEVCEVTYAQRGKYNAKEGSYDPAWIVRYKRERHFCKDKMSAIKFANDILKRDLNNLTIEQMIAFIKQNPNVKISHTSFTEDEYIYCAGVGRILDENDYLFEDWETPIHNGIRFRMKESDTWKDGWFVKK